MAAFLEDKPVWEGRLLGVQTPAWRKDESAASAHPRPIDVIEARPVHLDGSRTMRTRPAARRPLSHAGAGDAHYRRRGSAPGGGAGQLGPACGCGPQAPQPRGPQAAPNLGTGGGQAPVSGCGFPGFWQVGLRPPLLPKPGPLADSVHPEEAWNAWQKRRMAKPRVLGLC